MSTFMTVTKGTRLGPYEILSPLGAGGMGEVWRARDTRLDRSVAVKILPGELAQNAVLRLRFDREARAISQLNHPHICTIHDVGHENGTDYLVMELLEGESLAERIAHGPLPLDQVLRYAVEIADALDRAHRSGIVHRDLKPANVMITKAGAKLLDFGLAKSASSLASRAAGMGKDSHGDAPSPAEIEQATRLRMTDLRPLTEEGTIVGTFQYMAPEQFAGEEADARTDIFSFGAVLYEMLTGRRAFQGKSRTSLIGAIVGGEPQRVSEIQPLTPPALEHVIARCLAKDPDDRWQSAHDVAEELRWISREGSQAGVAAPLAIRRKQRERIFAASTLLLLLAAGGLAWALWQERGKPVRVQRSSIVAPAGVTFALADMAASGLTISPDGRYVTFVARDAEGPSLWLHSLETGESRPLARGHSPFWSPDSKSIAFYSDKLRRIDISGGPAVAIAEGGNGRGGTWGVDGTIVYEPHWRDALHRVPASGGKSTPVTVLDPEQGETTHRWPSFLPDGRHFLYLAGSHKVPADSDVNAIYIGSLDSPERKLLLRARSNAVYANGHVLFVRENYLMAQPFDPKKRELRGEPVRVAQDVTTVPGFFRALFGVSNDGSLVYFTGKARGARKMKWAKPDGTEISTVAELDFFGNDLRMSPDETRVAATVGDPWDLWIVDLERGTPTRFTNDPMEEWSPVWAPDGSRIAYASNRTGYGVIHVKGVDGLSREVPLFERTSSDTHPTDWSPDGRFLLADVRTEQKGDIWLVPLDGEEKPVPFIESDFHEFGARFSPDGRWVAFVSEESGRPELYAVTFPDRRVKKQLTSGGVWGFRWQRDGRSITFVQPGRTLMSISVDGDSFGVARPIETVPPHFLLGEYLSESSSMLVIEEERIQPSPITLVTNWPHSIRKR
jgi:eukaryotic-like serine/threonine-protein kinase